MNLKRILLLKLVICITGILPLSLFSQSQKDSSAAIRTLPGRFTIGLRGTASLFSHDGGAPGFGGGGQMRILVHERINTEWFSDIIFTDVEGLAQRQDYHIGWSVIFYILKPKNFTRKFLPYAVAGNCFDYTRIVVNKRPEQEIGRFSSAVQMGGGLQYNISPKFDISLTAQYMLHLGPDVHAHVHDGEVELEEHPQAAFEGHFLLSFSINYKIAQLWKRKK